ncbi:MAG TPA: hypothetical protein VIH30_11175 [Aquirhabdus sp.]
MTNENLKVNDILLGLDNISVVGIVAEHSVQTAINLIKSQQTRIDLLESAIREFLKADDELILGRADEELQKLRKLMENEK